MSKKSILILLFISIAFNLAVLGSMLWFHLNRPHHPPLRGAEISHLDLPEHIQHRMRDPEITCLRDQFEQNKLELLQELRKDPINEENIAAIIDSSLMAQSTLERRLGNRLIELRKKMSAQEADEYFGKRIEYTQNRKHHIQHRRPRNEKDNTD